MHAGGGPGAEEREEQSGPRPTPILRRHMPMRCDRVVPWGGSGRGVEWGATNSRRLPPSHFRSSVGNAVMSVPRPEHQPS